MAVAFLTASNIVAKFSRGLIGLFIIYWFGVSADTDAFFVAFSSIMIVYTLICVPFETIVVPYVTEVRKKGWEELSGFLSSLISVTAVLFVLFLPAILLFLYLYMNVLSGDIKTALVFKVLLVMYPMLIFSSISSILRGSLNALEFYGYPSFSIVVSSGILVAASIMLSRYAGIYGLGTGFVAGELVSVIFLALLKKSRFPHIKLGARFSFNATVKDLYAKNSNIIIGMVFLWVANLVNMALASHAFEGGVTVYEYSMRILYLFAELYGGFYIYKLVKFSQNPNLSGSLNRILLLVSVTGLAFVVPAVILKDTLLDLILRKSSPESFESFSGVLPLFLMASLVYTMGQLLTRWLTATKFTEVLRNVAGIKSACLILISVIFFMKWKLYGIGMSIVVSESISLILLYLFALERQRRLHNAGL